RIGSASSRSTSIATDSASPPLVNEAIGPPAILPRAGDDGPANASRSVAPSPPTVPGAFGFGSADRAGLINRGGKGICRGRGGSAGQSLGQLRPPCQGIGSCLNINCLARGS